MRMLPLQAGSSLLTTYSLSSTPKPGPATGRLSVRAGSCSCLQLGCWSWLVDWRVIETAPEREVQVNPVVDSSPLEWSDPHLVDRRSSVRREGAAWAE